MNRSQRLTQKIQEFGNETFPATVTTEAGHSHSFEVATHELLGGHKTLFLKNGGEGPHTHKFHLESDQLASIKKGEQVTVVTSDVDGHKHTVVFN